MTWDADVNRQQGRPDRGAQWSAVARPFAATDLPGIRQAARAQAAASGFPADRCTDVAIVVSELATNSILHGGGHGTIRSWTDGGCVVHEISDRGHIADPHAGARLPAPDQPAGRGLWIVNQLSDHVHRRSTPGGTVTTVVLGPGRR